MVVFVALVLIGHRPAVENWGRAETPLRVEPVCAGDATPHPAAHALIFCSELCVLLA